jgi:methyl-coenzyme M reductase subunit C
MPIGRVTQVVDCREAMGMGKGGGIAQRGTISECRYPGVIGAYFGLTDKEIVQIEKHKIAILHHGNVRSHVVHKIRFILQACDVKAVVVSQAPIDYEDLAKEGVKTAVVMPPADRIRTKGTVMAIVSGVTRGQTPTREKMAEVISSVMRLLKKKEIME